MPLTMSPKGREVEIKKISGRSDMRRHLDDHVIIRLKLDKPSKYAGLS